MPETIIFYFDFVSPFSYLAHQRLPGLAQRFGYSIDYRPIDLRAAKLAAGNTGPATRDMPLKLAYARKDQQRWAQRYGVPIKAPRSHDWSRLTRGAFYAIDRGQARPYVAHVWHHIWGEGGEMNDGVLRDAARAMGWGFDAFAAFTEAPETVKRLEASTREAGSRGVFGVPSMVVDDEMWWGNDRLDFLEEFLSARTKR